MIDCHRCEHYYVTWERTFPHGCRAVGFKSSQLPSIVVRVNSGRECLSYQEKTKEPKDAEAQ
jgi:hypothetical protein